MQLYTNIGHFLYISLTPAVPWLSVSRIIEDYPQTKALAIWTSGVVLSIEPNTTAYKRDATVQITSFSKTAKVKVVQAGCSASWE